MEEVIKIEGKHRLNGTVTISGSKNAAVALIPACVLSNEPITISGVPDISDVQVLKKLLRYLNVNVIEVGPGTLFIDPSHMVNKPMDIEEVNKLRGSYYFMGALLGKYGHVEILLPGGCYLGPRPVDLHFKGFKALGAEIQDEESDYIVMDADELKGTTIHLDITSVGATINIMMAAVFAKGRTIIENAAREPEIIDIATLLNKMGARIYGMGTDTLIIEGVNRLHGCFHEVIPDRIEAATYVLIAAAAAEDMWIKNIIPRHLEAILVKLEELGVEMDVGADFVHVFGNDPDKVLNSLDIVTNPYPEFATDVQQPFTPLLTRAQGRSCIIDNIYSDRFNHCYQLNNMGANIEVSSSMSYVDGPTELKGTRVKATDLRGGAAMVIAGLMAEGITEIYDIYHIDRGYENLDDKLRQLGANIWRETKE